MVLRDNLDLAVEKFNVNIADAKIEAAKVFHDPSIAVDWSRNSEDYSLSTEISKTFELGQKRKARIDLAKSEGSVTNALLNDYLRDLKADATLDYLWSLKQGYLFGVMQNSYQMMKELAEGDSVRFLLGSINAIDALQSKIEAGILLNELFQIESDRKNSYVNLYLRTSKTVTDTLLIPEGNFDKFERSFELNDLLIVALNSRSDLEAAKCNMDYTQRALTLVRKERRADIDLKAGASNSYLNAGNSSTDATEIFAGIEIPLNFSNRNKGKLDVAKYEIQQGELLYKQVEVGILTEVMKAFNQYQSLCRQVDNYDQGLLEQAKMVLKAKMYSYSRGETSLLEVLNAQRTYNDLQISYYETSYSCFESLVELERAVGIWDIKL